MYRLIVETLFGLHLEVDQLHLNPHLPKAWDSFKIHYRYRNTFYHLSIARSVPESTGADHEIVLDGKAISGRVIFLIDDRREHSVEMKIR